MVYRVIGTMSGSSLDGLDIAFVEFQETSGKWTYQLRNFACYEYSEEWIQKLSGAVNLNTLNYLTLHTEYGAYTGELINRFIKENALEYQVQLIASHGHTTFHVPGKKMTAQLGCGAAIAATTGINVVSDLRAMDVALGGQGAPIVPIGEKLLLNDSTFFLNIGGIANLTLNNGDKHVAFDVCPANRVLNLLAQKRSLAFDNEGSIASSGKVNVDLLDILNDLDYYKLPYPKSLSNDFGTDVIMPLISGNNSKTEDNLRTYVEHIVVQVTDAMKTLLTQLNPSTASPRMLVTGGGAKNTFLVERLTQSVDALGVKVQIPSPELMDFKEAIVMALIGLLRWREENNTLSTVTGAKRDSIGGAVWIGQEA